MTLPWLTLPVLALGAAWMAAVALAVWGFRGRLVGDAPYCRHCKYNLTGLTSNNCPECGFAITVAGVISGYRQRRTALLVMGAALALVSASGLGLITYGRVKRVDWYTYYPVSSLLRLAQANDRKALGELFRRAWDDSLPDATIPRVIAVALTEQSADTATTPVAAWADILTALGDHGLLSPEQTAAFRGQLARFSLSVRPVVRQGDPIPYTLVLDDRSGTALGARHKVGMRKVGWRGDGEVYRIPHPAGEPPCYPIGGTFGFQLIHSVLDGERYPALVKPGRHRLECRFTQAIIDAEEYCATGPARWSSDVSLEATFDVVTADAPDPIRMIDQVALGEVLKRTISVRHLAGYGPSGGDLDRFAAQFDLAEPTPLSLAFDVFVVTDASAIKIGAVVWAKGKQGRASCHWQHSTRGDFIIPSPRNEVTLELRASRAAASQTLDCFEVWNGTLRFGTVPIEREYGTNQ